MTTSLPKQTTYQFSYTRDSRIYATELCKFRFIPLIKVALIRGSSVIKTEGYIDTGAQWCLFQNTFAKHIGIKDYKDTSYTPIPISGVSGPGSRGEYLNYAYFHKLKLAVFKDLKNLKLKSAWVIDTEVGFLEKDFGFSAILGVRGFLDQFAFKTNVPEGYFELEPLFEVSV